MEYIIHKNVMGYWGVWASEPNWRECQPLSLHTKREQAEEEENRLLLMQYKVYGELEIHE